MTRIRPVPAPRSSVLFAACLLALSGCTSMAPHYVRPPTPVSDTLPAQPPTTMGDARAVAELQWRQVFLDPRLQQVIALALENNRDLRIALLNIESQRAQYRIQRASSLPAIDASASQSRSRGSDTSGEAGVSRGASAEVGIASWELDLFGRIRSLNDQALETWLATTETQRGTRLSLVAEVATAWLTLCADQQRLELATQTLHNQQQTLALSQQRHAQGIASGLDLAQVEASVQSARADVASYTAQLAQDRNALELLAGTHVQDTLLPSSAELGSAVALAPIPPDLDSRVLLERPDVLAAEHALKAANANIGAARAAFFPSISLTASTGRSSDALSSLFSGGQRTWSFVPSISIPIFHAGALKAELDVATLGKHIEVARYEKSIQSAFAEVADALVARANLDEQLDAQHALVDANQRGYTLADTRYRAGVDGYLEALDAQRSLYAALQAQITLQLSEANNRVALYKVLGGGADAQPSASAAASASVQDLPG